MKKLIPFIIIIALVITGILCWLRWQAVEAESYYDDDEPRKHNSSTTEYEYTQAPEETVSPSQLNVSLAPDSPFRIKENTAPIGDGMVRYVDELIRFSIYPPYEAENPQITVTLGDEELVEFRGLDLMGRETYVLLKFLQAGETTLTMTLEETGYTETIHITIKEEFDHKPENERLAPGEVGTWIQQAAQDWGMEIGYGETDTKAYAYLDEEELTWTQVRSIVFTNCGSWWEDGYRYVYVVYRGEYPSGYSYHIYLS